MHTRMCTGSGTHIVLDVTDEIYSILWFYHRRALWVRFSFVYLFVRASCQEICARRNDRWVLGVSARIWNTYFSLFVIHPFDAIWWCSNKMESKWPQNTRTNTSWTKTTRNRTSQKWKKKREERRRTSMHMQLAQRSCSRPTKHTERNATHAINNVREKRHEK